jgi:DNA mismatch repair protein MutL
MSKKIKLLPEKLINKIAAGEVVERPASVVKELLENAIDAKSDKIKIEIKDGGKKLIKITDNGEGMSMDDLFLAFERHATSKISKFDDLYNIHTLGFRGEALPSIAAVSKIKATTKSDAKDTGAEIIIEGGIVKKVSEIAMNRGFSIEVKDLFFNTPARLKFLKKAATEYFHIDNVIKRFLIVNPYVDFTVINNNRGKHYPKCKKLSHRIREIYGERISSYLLPFRIEDNDFLIHGFITPPEITSPSSYDINVFLNGRYIRDRTIFSAIRDALKGKIFDKRFPYVFIFIEMAHDKVDVNVHPAKLEVKFQNEKRIYSVLREILEKIISESSVFLQNKSIPESKDETFSKVKNFIKSSIEKYMPQKSEAMNNDFFVQDSYQSMDKESEIFTEKKDNGKYFSSLEIIGTFLDTFIILKDKDRLILLDQHAAHERIQMEKFKKQLQERKVLMKKFLIPEILELNESHKKIFEKHFEKFSELGFLIDKLDDKTFILKGIPVILQDINMSELIEILTEEFEKKGTQDILTDVNENILAKFACKAAIKAGVKLDDKSITHLLQELDSIPNNRTCPHGRPVIIELTKNEILKRFKRTV